MDRINNNQLEKLFYKVIHNKYLLNKIIEQIHNNDWVIYDNIHQIRYNNRIKFKNIESFKWMVKKNLIELLKCKLEAGDPIIFDIGIEIINNINDKETIFKLILDSTSIYKKDQLIFESLHLLDPLLLEISLNPPYSIPIDLIIHKINKETPPNQINTIYNHLYNKIIEICNNNNNNNNNNNSDNYNNYIKLMNILIEKIYSIDQVYSFNKILSNIFNSNNDQDNSNSTSPTTVSKKVPIYNLINIPKLDIQVILFKIVSNDIQITLLKKNLYHIPYYLQHHKHQIPNYLKSYISELMNNSNNSIINNGNNNGTEYIKPIIELIDSKIPIELLLNLDLLKLFLENNKYNWKGFKFNNLVIKKHPAITLEYIKFYIELKNHEEYKYFRIGAIEEKISKYLFKRLHSYHFDEKEINLVRDSEFKSFVDYIKLIPIENERALSIKWINLIRRLSISKNQVGLVIMDTETLDYISENFKIELYSLGLEFNSFEVYQYAKKKNILDYFSLSESKLFENLILNNGDNGFDQALKLQSGVNLELYIRIQNCISYSNKIKLVMKYIKNIRVLSKCIGLFLDESSSTTPRNFIKDSGMNIGLINEIFKKYMDFRTIKIILSNIDDNSFYDKDILYANKFSNSKTVSDTFLDDRTDVQAKDILNTIRFVLDYYNNHSTETIVTQLSHESYQIKKELFERILNYLFKTIIYIKSVTINQVLEAYQLINNSKTFKVYSDSPIYFANYITIKSFKLIKYVLESPIFKKQSSSSLYIGDYIDLSTFSIEFILGSTNNNESFDIILNQLINQLSYQLIITDSFKLNNIVSNYIDYREEFCHNDTYEEDSDGENWYEDDENDEREIRVYNRFIYQLLNYNLEYLMDINRKDLVLKHLEIIKSQHMNHFNNIDFQFSNKFIQQCIQTGFTTPIINNSMKLINFPTNPFQSSSIFELYSFIKSNHSNNNNITEYSEINQNDLYRIAESNGFKIQYLDKHFYSFPLSLSFKCYKDLLSRYPNHPILKPSKKLILKAFDSRLYFFLKYLLANRLIDDERNKSKEFNKLVSYLKSLISNHNYEFTIDIPNNKPQIYLSYFQRQKKRLNQINKSYNK